jgi:hypothetical protein
VEALGLELGGFDSDWGELVGLDAFDDLALATDCLLAIHESGDVSV